MTLEQEGTETAVPEEGEQPLTAEQVDELKSQLRTANEKIESQEKSYKGLQQTVNQKDTELKRQGDLRGEMEALRESQKLTAAILAESTSIDPNDIDTNTRAKLMQKLETETQRIESDGRRRAAEAQQAERTTQATAIYERAKTAISDPIALKDIEISLVNGVTGNNPLELEKAELLVAKAEGSKGEEVKETEEQKVERLVEERYNKKLEDSGLLKGEGTRQGGANETDEAIRAAYIANPDNPENARKNEERRNRNN